jgi:small subunit ribosomal protein S8
MAINDPIADMLTRIRNATRNKAKHVACMNNKVCRGVAQCPRRRGLHQGLRGRRGPGQVGLHQHRPEVRPARRAHHQRDQARVQARAAASTRGVADIPRPLQGLGISIVSTSQGRHERPDGPRREGGRRAPLHRVSDHGVTPSARPKRHHQAWTPRTTEHTGRRRQAENTNVTNRQETRQPCPRASRSPSRTAP